MKALRPGSDLFGLRRRWSQLSPRERALVAVLAVTAAAYVAISLVARPLLAERARVRAEIAHLDMALARLAAIPADSAAPARPASNEPVTAIATDTAAAAAIPIRRIEPNGDGAELTIEDAPFPEVLDWIDELETTRGLKLVALEMERRPEPGMVSATLSLQR